MIVFFASWNDDVKESAVDENEHGSVYGDVGEIHHDVVEIWNEFGVVDYYENAFCPELDLVKVEIQIFCVWLVVYDEAWVSSLVSEIYGVENVHAVAL